MKKLLLLVSLFGFFALNMHAQCTPKPFNGGLTNPDSTLSYAAATQYYEQVIHVRIPEDTMLPPLTMPIPIDSAGVTNVTGLPSSFTYQTNSSTDTWPGNSYGCVVLQGTPTTADTGTINFDVHIVIYAMGQAVPFTITYELIVLDSTHVGFEAIETNSFALKQNQPNPANGQTQIDFRSERSGSYTFNIYNVQGQAIYTKEIEAMSGINSIQLNTSDFPAGIYLYRLSNGIVSETKQMIIQ